MNRIETTACRARRDEAGMALLIAVILLLFISALGLTALQQAEDESSASGQSRRKDAVLYAAEAGLNLAEAEILLRNDAQLEPEATVFDAELVRDGFDQPIEVRSGTPDVPGPQKTGVQLAATPKPPTGYELREGGESALTFAVVRIDIMATDIAEGQVHLQSQYRLLLPGGEGY